MTEPAATVTSKADRGVWSEHPKVLAGSGTSCAVVDPRPVSDPAPTITGAGNAEWGMRSSRAPQAGSRDPRGTRVTLEEAAALQSFPADFIWNAPVPNPKRPGELKAPTKGKQFLQVGNAVPPLLAFAILDELVGAAIATERTELAA